MAIEFRPRSAGEIGQIVRRRLLHLLLPTLATGIAAVWVVNKLPNMYQSETLLTVKPPTISERVVAPMTDEDLSNTINTISQEVLSRSSLEPMISKYKLFENERAANMPMELIVEKMKKSIVVEIEKTDEQKVASFRIKYKDREQRSTQQVTAELASKFVNAQMESAIVNSGKTREFIDNQLGSAKDNLDVLEKERLRIMMQNVETLPESSAGLIAQLDGLRKREETISKEKETLINEKGRVNQMISSTNSNIRLIEQFGERDAQDGMKDAADITQLPAYGALINKRAELTARLEKLRLEYREKHPDILDTKTQIDKVNEELRDLEKTSNKRVQATTDRTRTKTELNKKSLDIEKQRLEAQIVQIEQNLKQKDIDLQQNDILINNLEAKINSIPNVKVALEGINTQYQTAKATYDDLLKKRNDAQLQLERDSNAQGETIRVVDAANFPQSSINASKKPMLILMGAGVGLVFGLFLVGLSEVPRLFKIQNIEDAKHYTGLPVLASVPPLLTSKEISWRNRMAWIKVFVAIILAIGSIPLIIIALQTLKIFERMVS